MKKTKILCVLDGFGISSDKIGNPFWVADIPNFKKLLSENIWTTMNADGTFVGQETGLVGNSEVGHMNMGGLQLVKQLSLQITESSNSNYDLKKENTDQKFDPKKYIVDNSVVHMIGLFSSGTIHSDLRHWIGAIKAALKKNSKIYLHLISDGRDSDRMSFLESWDSFTKENSEVFDNNAENIFLGSISGRFYAMDRDNNQDRIDKYYNCLKEKDVDVEMGDISEVISRITEGSYKSEKYDEFIEPVGFRGFKKDEIIWFINFRTDRMKQIVKRVCEGNNKGNDNNLIIANNNYGNGLEKDEREIKKRNGYYPIFENNVVKKTLSEYISKKNMNQLHIAETEKFNHVTYFFNGGSNKKQKNEDWVVIDSNKIESHASKPEMKAKEVTDYILKNGIGLYDYIIVNYANCDMVGHTGDFSASVKSLEVLDKQIGRLVKKINSIGGSMLITADHGNIEKTGLIDSGKVDTKHNPNPVPLILVGDYDVEKMLKYITPKMEADGVYIDQFKSQLTNYNQNKIDFTTGWLEKSSIPTPVLPLWYVGLILIGG